jgi:predicted Zn finger-like uncharacterized protein
MTGMAAISTVAVLDVEAADSGRAACPLCHTPHASLSDDAVNAGEEWRCTRCGQRWDARRLASVAAYAASIALFKSGQAGLKTVA